MGKIVWLASYPESGAYWFSMFLANLIAGSREPCSRLERDLIIPAENSAKLYQPFFSRPLDEVPMQELAGMRPTVHRELANRASDFLFLRTHSAAVRHFGHLTITPEATAAAIYLVRNPLDIAPSYGAAKGRSLDKTIGLMAETGRVLGKSSKRTYQVVGSWSENVESWTSTVRGRILTIRFEDMLDDPELQFSKAIQFLSINATAEQITRASDNSINAILQAYKKLGGQVPNHLSPLELLRSGAAIRGKRLLTTQQIAAIANTHHEQMHRFAYWG
ncbi:MAG TPA: sulfotransferase domain-containing protein [Aestuariivirga sp.]|nr:sulfotransferase domain-containing protein [Aestuariivirga sp.]